MADNSWLCRRVITTCFYKTPLAFCGFISCGKNLRIFLAIRYIAGRAMAKDWLLKFGFKLKNCKFQEKHPSQALFPGFFFFKSSNQKKRYFIAFTHLTYTGIFFFQILQSVSTFPLFYMWTPSLLGGKPTFWLDCEGHMSR